MVNWSASKFHLPITCFRYNNIYAPRFLVECYMQKQLSKIGVQNASYIALYVHPFKLVHIEMDA